MSDFHEYLVSKKIDPDGFKAGDPERYEKFKMEFDQMHPNSFTNQKLFLINRIRREFQLKEEVTVNQPKPAVKSKPKIVPRIKK